VPRDSDDPGRIRPLAQEKTKCAFTRAQFRYDECLSPSGMGQMVGRFTVVARARVWIRSLVLALVPLGQLHASRAFALVYMSKTPIALRPLDRTAKRNHVKLTHLVSEP